MKKKTFNTFILLFLLLINFIAHVAHYQDMGLYEDDYGFFGKSINWDQAEYNSHLKETITGWTRGTPLGYTIPGTTAYLVKGDHAVQKLYLIGLLILTVNAFLFYLVVYQWLGDKTPAIIAAIVFSLFPADTSKSLLTHIYHIQISVMFCLWAILIFLRYPKVRFLSYVFGFFCLIQYETPFSLFFLLPLFTNERSQKRFWLKHLIFSVGLVVLAVSMRILLKEGRIMGLGNWPTTLAQLIAGMVIGPVVSMGLFLYGPARTVLHMNWEVLIVMGVTFPIMLGGIVWLFHKSSNEINQVEKSHFVTWKLTSLKLELPRWVADWLKKMGMVSLWLMTAYSFAFTHFPPVARYGRGTSVHISATIPAALLFTLFICGIWRMVTGKMIWRTLFMIALASYFSVTMGNRYSIQQDFVKSWTFQKQFWQQVIALTSDAKDETMVFVINHNLPEEHYIISNSWADYFILEELIDYPADWSRKPIVLVTDGNWEKNIKVNDAEISYPWNHYWDFSIDPDNVILLTDTSDGKLKRVDNVEITTLSGVLIKPMPLGNKAETACPYEGTQLYNIMIGGECSSISK